MTRHIDSLDYLSPTERDVVTFNFEPNLRPGEAVDTIVETSCVVYEGKDPNAADVMVGPPQLEGNKVLQEIYGENGKEGVGYVLLCTVEITPSGRRATGAGIIYISTPGRRK